MSNRKKSSSTGPASVSKPGKTGKGRNKAAAPKPSHENTTLASAGTSPEVVVDREQGSAGELVRLYDIEGFAVIALPAQLREILGEEAFVQRAADLGDYEFTVVLRHPGQVVHVKLPVYVGAIDRNDQGQLTLKSPTPTESAEKAAQRAWPEAAHSAIIAKLEKRFG